jgi:hypothetical protein
MVVPRPRAKAPPEKPQMDPATRLMVLESLGLTIAQKRKEAIEGRQALGIEKVWTEDEEHYQGFDDANRHEFHEVKSKPTEGGRSSELPKPKGSTLFPNLTAPYTDAAAAKVADMLLPTDDRNFVVEPSPVPDILDEDEGWPELLPPEQIQPPGLLNAPPAGLPPAAQPATPAAAIQGDPAAAAGMPGQPQAAPAQPAPPVEQDLLAPMIERLKKIREKAVAAAEHFEKKVDDDLVECSFATEMRSVIDDCARLGTGVLKGPFPVKRKVKKWARNPDTGMRELTIKSETRRASKRVNPWNAFPDPGCGEDIHNGGYFLERDFLTPKKLRELKGGQGAAAYLDRQIDKVLEEGPLKRAETAPRGFQQDAELGNKDNFEVWYYYGAITGKELAAAGCECEDEDKQFHVVVTLVNDTVIKAALNPLDSGEFPFDLMAWKKRPNMPYGSGVPRAGRVAQRTLTAALRAMMDNAGASSRPHKVITDAIEQGDDPWTWRANSESLVDVSKGMMFFVQPSLQAEFMAIMQKAEQMMELHTGLPMIILGMQGNVQETASGRALQNNNGSTVLRRIARNFDAMNECHIKRYHTWEMLHGDDPLLDGMDLQIKARGSSALVERDLQNQQLPSLMSLSLNPAFGWSPKRTGEEYLKAQRFDPKAFELTDKEKQEAQQNVQPPVLPQVEAAKVRDAGETQRMQMKLQHDAQQGDLDRNMELALAQIEAQLASATLSAEERMALDDIKANLAGITLKIKTQRELSAMKGGQLLAPPTEPAGRAPNGAAFQA